MRRTIMAGMWISTLVVGVTIPEDAPAELRWRTDGNACIERTDSTDFTSYSGQGLRIEDGSFAEATCPIPVGASLVDLGDGSGHPIDKINVRVGREGTSAIVNGRVIVHDYDSTSSCMCGQANKYITAGNHDLLVIPFDCGACSYGTNWVMNAHIAKTGQSGYTLIKLISVYDE